MKLKKKIKIINKNKNKRRFRLRLARWCRAEKTRSRRSVSKSQTEWLKSRLGFRKCYQCKVLVLLPKWLPTSCENSARNR